GGARGGPAAPSSIPRDGPSLGSFAAVVGMAGQDGEGAIELLQEHDPRQLMGPGGSPEGEAKIGLLAEALRHPVGAADEESRRRPALVAPPLQLLAECRRREIVAAFVEHDPGGRVGNELRQSDRLLGLAALGFAGVAFANLDDLDPGEPHDRTNLGDALAIALRQVAVRPLLEAAYGGDDQAHRRTLKHDPENRYPPRIRSRAGFFGIAPLGRRPSASARPALGRSRGPHLF